MSGQVLPTASEVKVRMYRQGLGDCFLLAFPGNADGPRYVLIDCGLIAGAPDRERLKGVVADIRQATGGDVHLLVLTHEHWDHVSGFLEAEQEFKALRIHRLWFAWTEDPSNELAERLRAEREEKVEALRQVVTKAKDKAAIAPVAALIEFFGAAGSATTKDALCKARQLVEVEADAVQYCYPHQSQLLPGTDNVRVYFLGPPESEPLLRHINPSTQHPEDYTEAHGEKSRASSRKRAPKGSTVPSADAGFIMAARYPESAPTDQDRERFEFCFPFDSRYRIPLADAKKCDFFERHHGIDRIPDPVPADGDESDVCVGPAWRRIDDDWLGASGELALALDSLTNNTSLALAFELTPGGKVLLFPADAQVGNWLSWHLASWTLNENGSTRTVTAQDLLARTVLYKVGHHGSHNATMRSQGLEMMTHPELVAMLPVHVETAHHKGWLKMPFEPLLTDLRFRTKGRVIQLDQDLPDDVDAAIWEQFRPKLVQEDLYFEYTIEV